MRYLSVCSGIEAATVAWHHMGWSPVGFSEIETFPSQVLAHHYPDVPNLGDMNRHEEWPIEQGTVDLLVGGTPCQSFSVAGLRKGLSDPRGNLALVYLSLLDRLRPRWCVWENVPGVLTSSGGRDFGSFLGGLSELGYGFAYRVLDAQWFGVAQRRRRVFVVGHLGDWRRAAAVLFERASFGRHPAPSREARKEAAPGASGGAGRSRVCLGFDRAQVTHPENRSRIEPHKAMPTLAKDSQPHVAISDVAPTLAKPECLTLEVRGREGERVLEYRDDGTANCLRTPNGGRDGLGVGAVAFQSKHSNGPISTDETTPCLTSEHPLAVAMPRADLTGYALTAGDQKRPELRDILYVNDIGVSVPIDTTGADPTRKQGGTLIGPKEAEGGGGNKMSVAIHAIRESGPGFWMPTEVSGTLDANMGGHANRVATVFVGQQAEQPFDVANCLTRRMHKGMNSDCNEGQTPVLAVGFQSNLGSQGGDVFEEVSPTVRVGSSSKGKCGNPPGVAVAPTLTSTNDPSRSPQSAEVTQQVAAVHATSMQVRRLTPTECERLQGFPDGYTAIPVPGKRLKDGTVATKAAADGPRYKALGNSMAVPVMRWIGERIQMVEEKLGKGT